MFVPDRRPPDGDRRTPRRVGRNCSCPCGSGRKYKRCCGRDPKRSPVVLLPAWILDSRRKLCQLLTYGCQVLHLPRLLHRLTDGRREPRIPTFDVVNSLFHTALLRIPSINALEGDLKEGDFQALLGKTSKPDVKLFSAEVVANVLDKLDIGPLRQAMRDVFRKAERNKAFRDQTYGALRCVAIDAWEAFSSYHRHCPDCLEREIVVDEEPRTQYYHRYVVALFLGPVLDVVMDIEPIRNKAARIRAGESRVQEDEGELTAALRLVDRLHETYGSIIDAFSFDSLYPNGPVLNKLAQYRYGAFIIVKKKNNQPLKEALALWRGQPPCRVVHDPKSREDIEFWDTDQIETLDTYKGPIRVIRARVTQPSGKKRKRTWCIAVVGKRALRLSLTGILKATRARWHIENTAFHQWVMYWHLNHVFRHTANATLAVLLLWSLAFNLLQLFIYRRLKRQRNPKDPTDTIRHIVEVMNREIATLVQPVPWATLLDTS